MTNGTYRGHVQQKQCVSSGLGWPDGQVYTLYSLTWPSYVVMQLQNSRKDAGQFFFHLFWFHDE